LIWWIERSEEDPLFSEMKLEEAKRFDGPTPLTFLEYIERLLKATAPVVAPE
jgi:hypothetical protein